MSDAKDPLLEGEATLPILDVRELSLDAVLRARDSALANAVRLVLDAIDRPDENYAAHGSSP